MKIDLSKCYKTMQKHEPPPDSVSIFVRRRIHEYFQAYHEQLMEQLADRYINHLCLAHGLTNEAAKAQAEPQPHEEPPETCYCVGRKRLVGLNMLHYDTRTCRWFRSTNVSGQVQIVFCPFCDKRLP